MYKKNNLVKAMFIDEKRELQKLIIQKLFPVIDQIVLFELANDLLEILNIYMKLQGKHGYNDWYKFVKYSLTNKRFSKMQKYVFSR